MRKIFNALFVAVMMNYFIMPTASAEVATLESSMVKNSDVTFCGYALFAAKKKELELRAKIQTKQLQLERNPNDAKTRHELAKLWHELGRILFAEADAAGAGAEGYEEALDAFNKAVELEPNNAEFKRDRDVALAKVKSGAKPAPTPKFNGLG